MKAHNIFKSILALSLAVIAVSSCQEKIGSFTKGEAVKFSVGTDASDTKAAYSGDKNTAGTIERIDWETGDLIRIYCGQASGSKSADYAVTSVNPPSSGSEKSTAFIESAGGAGLLWGEGEHTFYAVYPSPEEESGITTNISPYTDGGTKGSVSKSIEGAVVAAKLPATQAVIGGIKVDGVNNTVAPDLKNMLMTAMSGPYTESTGIPMSPEVFLNFIPLTTAVQFTITNQTKAPLIIKSVSLTSAGSPLNGPFTVDISDETDQPDAIDLNGDGNTTGEHDIRYSHTYPKCTYTGTFDAITKTVTINFATPVTLAYDEVLANCGKLTFTFFLQPCQNFNDLSFKLTKSDNSWMSTRLGYTDGTGVLFPRFKKTTVKGLLVPEGAQWTVKYAPTVNPWNNPGDTPIGPMPEVNEGMTLVTSWDTSSPAEELELTDSYKGHAYVEIGGKKWATMNVGATTVAGSPSTCYGHYFFWGGTEGYEYDSTNSKWVKASDHTTELSDGFCWKNTPFNNGSSNYDETYFNAHKSEWLTDDILKPDYDAAHANWGGSWRMPKKEDFQALYEACGGMFTSIEPTTLSSSNPGQGIYWVSETQEYISEYTGVAGLLFCDGNGNRLFFPAACFGDDASLFSAGSFGDYWSSSFDSEPNYAYSLYFGDDDVYPQIGRLRYYGQSVRAVSD